MKMTPTEDDIFDAYYHLFVSEKGTYYVGLTPVIFGWRVVSFRDTDCGPYLNWCAGDKQADVDFLHSAMLCILRQRDEDSDVYEGLPLVSGVKPYYNDTEFVDTIQQLLPPDFCPVPVPALSLLRLMYNTQDEERRNLWKTFRTSNEYREYIRSIKAATND